MPSGKRRQTYAWSLSIDVTALRPKLSQNAMDGLLVMRAIADDARDRRSLAIDPWEELPPPQTLERLVSENRYDEHYSVTRGRSLTTVRGWIRQAMFELFGLRPGERLSDDAIRHRIKHRPDLFPARDRTCQEDDCDANVWRHGNASYCPRHSTIAERVRRSRAKHGARTARIVEEEREALDRPADQ